MKAAYSGLPVSVSARYTFIQAQPSYGVPEDLQELSFGSSARLAENWRIFGSGTYDLEKNFFTGDGFGFAYDDECFSYTMTLSQSRNRDTRELTQSIGFNISFRTLGDFGSTTGSFAQ